MLRGPSDLIYQEQTGRIAQVSVFAIVAAMASVAAVSAALYVALPTSVLECAERHGRFGGLASPAVRPKVQPPRTRRFHVVALQGAA
jgi:hypothetical protein